ncbi:uncharacterized protein FIBRA_07034 [Fibroporia radiculosa]|uniref:Glutaminase A central domain-containing protein n=1 Tax=Fibroporia radiculosa TaxID=599839 RepID=J4IBK9_9APHY|nr:uncharacterized protein FIBRA_07034 [Fibroporia radiculosa]CCM04841.1 predicted protein [Fibroporia radiculosa]
MLNSWAGYLADNALYPSNQVSLASPTASDNSTNVAAKGIIGIGAMGTINKLLNYDSDSSVNYSSIAAEYASHWESLAFVTSNGQAHLTSTYGGPESSWALVDSLFGDKLLATGVISSQVYDAQTQFYEQLIEDNPASYAFGLPMDDLSEIGNSAALAMVAATMTNASTCAQILSSIASYASVNTRVDIFASSYYVLNGSYISGPASPAQGALFAPMIMSLSIPPSNSTTPPTSYTPGSTPAKSHTSLGIILGAVFGSVAGVSIFTIAAVVFVRHRRYKAVPIDLPISSPHLLYDTVTPFVPSEDGVSGSYVSPEDLRSAKMEGIRHAAVISRSGSNSTPSPSPPQSSTQPRSTAIPRTTAENATTRSASARSAATGSAATGSAASLLGQPDEGPGRNHVMTELRTEMSQLRQFMQSMNERMHVEAPPTYSE